MLWLLPHLFPIIMDPIESDSIVDECRSKLSEVDAILEPDVLSTLKSFLGNGGTSIEAVRSLSESYVGLPDLIATVNQLLLSIFDIDENVMETSLRALISDAFDPIKADQIFTSSTAAPEWMDSLCDSSSFVELCSELLVRHPQCLFLHYVQRQSAPKSVLDAYHLQTLQASMLDGFQALSKEPSLASLQKFVQHFINLGSATELSYLYCQHTLNQLRSKLHDDASPLLFLLEELSEIIRNAATKAYKESVIAIDCLLLPIGQKSDLHQIMHNLNRNLAEQNDSTNWSKGFTFSAVEIQRLGNINISSINSDDLKSLTLLPQKSAFFNTLINTLLFAMLSPNHRMKLSKLMATMVDPASATIMSSSKIDTLALSINDVTRILSTKDFLAQPLSHCRQLYPRLTIPIVGKIFVHFVGSQLTQVSFYDTAAHTTFTPLLLTLCGASVLHHPIHSLSLSKILMSILDLAIPLESLTLIEYQKSLIKLLFHCMQTGIPDLTPFFKFLTKFLSNCDHSLIRFTLVYLIVTTARPYSPLFLYNYLKLYLTCDSQLALKNVTLQIMRGYKSFDSSSLVIIHDHREELQGPFTTLDKSVLDALFGGNDEDNNGNSNKGVHVDGDDADEEDIVEMEDEDEKFTPKSGKLASLFAQNVPNGSMKNAGSFSSNYPYLKASNLGEYTEHSSELKEFGMSLNYARTVLRHLLKGRKVLQTNEIFTYLPDFSSTDSTLTSQNDSNTHADDSHITATNLSGFLDKFVIAAALTH